MARCGWPNMKVEASLRSQQPRQPHDITIITQCSLDRQAPSYQLFLSQSKMLLV